LALAQVSFSQMACWVPCNYRKASTRPAHFQITAGSRASDQLIGANAWLTFIGKWHEKAEMIQNTHEIDGARSSLWRRSLSALAAFNNQMFFPLWRNLNRPE
jgi:hypothetical protein